MRETLSLLLALLWHEAGHLAAAKLCGTPLRSFELRFPGAAFTFDFSRAGYLREAAVHFGGPAAGLLAAWAAAAWFGGRASFFIGASLAAALVNLLPIEGFDGGGIVRCLLERFLPPDFAWRIGRAISVLAVLLLWAAVLWAELRLGANLSLLLFLTAVMLSVIPAKKNGG